MTPDAAKGGLSEERMPRSELEAEVRRLRVENASLRAIITNLIQQHRADLAGIKAAVDNLHALSTHPEAAQEEREP